LSALANLLKLKYLRHLKSLGYNYTRLLEEFDTLNNSDLPSNINQLRTITTNCHLCDLAKNRTKVVFGEGSENAKVMFIGEGPGESEDETGRPFVGKAGELLSKMIENAIGIQRSSVYIANIVKCRPPSNRVPTHAEVTACKPYLLKQIEIIKPTIIVALGATALNSLLGEDLSITKVRGKQYKFANTTLIPTFHPSYLLRNPDAKKEAFEDMKLIKSLL
jgi:DNA polymerase